MPTISIDCPKCKQPTATAIMSKVLGGKQLDAYSPVAFGTTCTCKWTDDHYDVAAVYACERFLNLYNEKGMD